MRKYYQLSPGMPPYQQGGLDSLCGLYSIINAERIINHSSDDETQQLFDDLIHYLSRRGLLTKFLIGGIIHTEMLVILNKVVGKKRISNVEIPWRGVPNPDLTTFWKSIQYFLDGTPGRAVILGLQGYHDHWTVIENITNRTIILYDSALIKRRRAHPAPQSMPHGSASTCSSPRRHISSPTKCWILVSLIISHR